MRIVTVSKWFDRYHIHPSLYGCIQRDLGVLCDIEGKIRRIATARLTRFQCFIVINLRDSQQDAVYLHTPNENGTAFPWVLPGGVVTRNVQQYRGLFVALDGRGYSCQKLKGWPSVVAIHRSLASMRLEKLA